MRIAVVGHRTYFENHYPEGWERNRNILCLDVNETHYGWLNILHNFRPDVTLFYRPELYPAEYIKRVPGYRIAFLSEPVPNIIEGKMIETDETRVRMSVYKGMQWDAFHWRVFYDSSKKNTVKHLGYPIDQFHEIPINTQIFRPSINKRKRWDITFVGKATAHRIERLDFLRTSPYKFLWIAHGVSGSELATIFRQSKVVANVHADGQGAIEPRIYLAAASGAVVLTEPLSSSVRFFGDQIVEADFWNNKEVHKCIEKASYIKVDEDARHALSVKNFISSCYEKSGLVV